MDKLYETVGKRLEKENILYFNELKHRAGYEEPVLSDLEKLSELVNLFCKIQQISIQWLVSTRYDRKAVYNKQLCIAVCYRLYSPNSFAEFNLANRKLNSSLGALLNISSKKIWGNVQKSLFSYRYYKEFHAVTDEICKKIVEQYDSENKDW